MMHNHPHTIRYHIHHKEILRHPPPILSPYTTLFRSYVPRKEFRVRRRKKGEAWTIINDVGTFFQEAFAKLLENNEVDGDRKSTRLNSSHPSISYAVFCLKKKNIRWNISNC